MKDAALNYHKKPLPGKIKVIPSKACNTSEELSLAYSPGVAEPCKEIYKNKEEVYAYTSKGNLVGVISNGTAVLGLGNIGPLASKPVMEGKGVLFKRFANVDFFDIEIEETNVTKLVEIISALEPTFGGINLEDIEAPDCFALETQLIQRMNIPVFHDDQHGTAIVAAAGLINALEIVAKKINDIKIVVSGAAAAGIACANLLCDLGATNLWMFDSKGLITEKRKDTLNSYKQKFMRKEEASLEEAMKNADVFLGLSRANVVSQKMVKSMRSKPIVIAMANPNPEISYEDAKAAVPEVIMATGRSDYPNQINNVLCFPFLFRGALDVKATKINTEMKLAAVHALAELAKEEVPPEVIRAYGDSFSFGPDYILPKPFDPRVLSKVAPAVAEAAMNSGVARKLVDIEEYTEKMVQLSKELGKGNF